MLIGEGPAEWLRGLATLDPNRPPADFGAIWWRDLIRDAERFLPVWGQQAADLAWGTLDLFGVHRLAPAARYSCMGLLLLVRGGPRGRHHGRERSHRAAVGSASDLHATAARGGMRGDMGAGQRVTAYFGWFRRRPADAEIAEAVEGIAVPMPICPRPFRTGWRRAESCSDRVIVAWFVEETKHAVLSCLRARYHAERWHHSHRMRLVRLCGWRARASSQADVEGSRSRCFR